MGGVHRSDRLGSRVKECGEEEPGSVLLSTTCLHTIEPLQMTAIIRARHEQGEEVKEGAMDKDSWKRDGETARMIE